jgi:hypothetical protein
MKILNVVLCCVACWGHHIWWVPNCWVVHLIYKICNVGCHGDYLFPILDANRCGNDLSCHNLNLGLVTKARACKGAGQEWARESHFMLPGVQESVREWTPHYQVSYHFGSWSPNGLLNLQKAIVGVKTLQLKSSWNLDVYDELIWPIWVLKHKLWPKERLRVKLVVWLLTTKSQELP